VKLDSGLALNFQTDEGVNPSRKILRDSLSAHTDQAQFLEGEAGNRGATRTGRLEREANFPSGFIPATLTEKTL
jgi:hypothetical protein